MSDQPTSRFRLLRYFTIAGLLAFLPFGAALLYFGSLQSSQLDQVQNEQAAFFAQVQDSFATRSDAIARDDMLKVHQSGNVNMTRLFSNVLWKTDLAPLVAAARSAHVARCRELHDVVDATGKVVERPEIKACYAAIGETIMALPEFRGLDAKVAQI